VQCFQSLFQEKATFEEYLTKLFEWRSNSIEERLEFYFDLLDYDGDGRITPSDLSIFIQEAMDYRVTFDMCVFKSLVSSRRSRPSKR
jgi:hypothetical protein